MAFKSYSTLNSKGSIKRLDDFVNPWVDIDVPGSNSRFVDIMAVPGFPDRVIACSGFGREIVVSNNSGGTWNIPGGAWTTVSDTESGYSELWVVNNCVSYIVGENGIVLKSIDGGANFNPTGTFPTVTGVYDSNSHATCVHFINEDIGVVGVFEEGIGCSVWKTTDGGDTWTRLNGNTIVNNSVQQIITPRAYTGGIRLSDDQSTIVYLTYDKIERSTDFGATFSVVYQSLFPTPRPMRHLTWLDQNNLWATGDTSSIIRSIDGGATWIILQPGGESQAIVAAHFWTEFRGFAGTENTIPPIGVKETTDSGATWSINEDFGLDIFSVWTEESNAPCYTLYPCDPQLDPILTDVKEGTCVDLASVVGQVVNISVVSTGETGPIGISGCFFVELQDACGDGAPEWIANPYTLVGSDCASFELETCPVELPLTLVGDTTQFQVTVVNTGTDAHDFSFSLGSCTTTGLSIVTTSPINVAAGSSGVIDLEYTPTIGEQGTCEILVSSPCETVSCDICYLGVLVPACPHFNICITGPSCAPDCIKPGEAISFDLGGTIDPIAYPTVVTFQIVNQVTQEVVFTADYAVANDTELDSIIIVVPGLPPGKYCSEVCLPGCNTKRVLCFDVCEPFDIYKDSCNHWHVHRPPVCEVDEYLVSVKPLECGAPEDVVIDDVLWDVSQDNTFEFELPGDGIYIFEMKDPETGDVVHSFSAFETCALQECYHILMDKIMCSCSDPCCKRCDGTPEEHREFARMTLNKLVPLYMTYLGMAYRNKLYTLGSKLVQDDHMCFLHDACAILAKIHDIIMDCGCLCPEQKNTATNRGDCSSC